MRRQYKEASPVRGYKGHVIIEIVNDVPSPVLHFPAGTPPEVRFDVIHALGRAYQAGRSDAASEPLTLGEAMARVPHAEGVRPPRTRKAEEREQ
jgi:hypothetical protein